MQLVVTLVTLLQRIMLLQSALNIARAIPIFVFEFYPQMICVFLCLFALSIGKYGLRTLGLRALSVYWVTMIIVSGADVIAWLIALVELRLGYSSSEYAWAAFWTYSAMLLILLISNIVGAVSSFRLTRRMQTFTMQERLTFLRLQAGDIISTESDETSLRIISVRPSAALAPMNINSTARVVPVQYQTTDSEIDRLFMSFNHNAFCTNAIHKSTYTLLTFLPIFLYNQFSRLANLYTLVVVCLCFFSFSPLSPTASLLPLLIVLFTTAFRELFEDHKRKLQDSEINLRRILTLRSDSSETPSGGWIQPQTHLFQTRCWQDLRVGDVVRVERDQYFPADLLLISCDSDVGRVFVETAQLDGETNLKMRFALAETLSHIDVATLSNYQYDIQCEQPNGNLYLFDGTLSVTNLNTNQQQCVSVSAEQILLRGAKLKHNSFCIGIVVNTGIDTKIEQNSTSAPLKQSRMERSINLKFVMIFVMQTALCLICSFGYNRFQLRYTNLEGRLPNYLKAPGENDASDQFIFGSYVILFNSMIPLSMYVTMELVRYFNAQLIVKHPHMRVCRECVSGTEESYIGTQARNTSIVEDLGQVRYVFSDKTGTLTRNEMVMTQCCVVGQLFGSSAHTAVQMNRTGRHVGNVAMFESVEEIDGLVDHLAGWTEDDDSLDQELVFDVDDVTTSNAFCDLKLSDLACSADAKAPFALHFLKSLALCNTVIPSTSEHSDSISYQSSSSDETALVDAAKRLNVVLQSRNDCFVAISYLGRLEQYEVLGHFAFSSDRQRMSVVLRGPLSSEHCSVFLYCKGADSALLPRLNPDQPFPHSSLEETQKHLHIMSSAGLRTLCFGYRELSNDEVEQFLIDYRTASMSILDRQPRLDALADQYECDLHFLGISAIEDRLQEHVPHCISKLRKAGIKVCVCTGDKLETAVSIGYSSGLLFDEMDLVRIDAIEPDKMDAVLSNIIDKYSIEFNSNPSWFDQLRALYTSDTQLDRNAYTASTSSQFAIVIDGPSLTLALQPEHCDKFLSVLRAAVSALCCRCLPLQKASVVDLINRAGVALDDDFITLAIGDGANDCPMILKAHVGVGISDGKEGVEAVLAADFAIPRFAMLTRLLLVHGSHTYSRMAKLILFSFSKNIALALPNFWFAFVNGFSGQSMYWDFLFTWFNAVFTTAPILTLAFTDEHASDRSLLRFPALYISGMNNRAFGWPRFIAWLLLGMWVSMCVYGFALWTPQVSEIGPSGLIGGIWFAGVCGYGILIFALTAQVFLYTNERVRWRPNNVLSLVASPLIFFAFVSVYSALTTLYPDSAFIAFQLFGIPAFWLVLPLGTITAILPYIVAKFIKTIWFPQSKWILHQISLASGSNSFGL